MEKVELTSVVQETLMIPLIGRAMETEEKNQDLETDMQ